MIFKRTYSMLLISINTCIHLSKLKHLYVIPNILWITN